MRKKDWMLFAALCAAAAGLRAVQMKTGFDEEGLGIRGAPAGWLLLAVLLFAAVWLVLAGRRLPSRGEQETVQKGGFRFQGPATACAVAGSFALILGSLLSALGAGGSLLLMLLAAFGAVSGVCLLYAVFSLYRNGMVQGIALLAPVCYLAVYLIFLYREDASDPVLARICIEILAVAALTFSAMERSAFAYSNGSPRVYLPAGAIAVILSLCAAAEFQGLSSMLMFIGLALVEIGFLAAASFERE